jgi:hypothetical protein
MQTYAWKLLEQRFAEIGPYAAADRVKVPCVVCVMTVHYLPYEHLHIYTTQRIEGLRMRVAAIMPSSSAMHIMMHGDQSTYMRNSRCTTA